MNDNDIIKALECCINGKCAECPLEKMACSETVAMQYALALINRQKAEIESLQKAYLMYEETSGLKQAKSEAIKDFAEEFERRCIQGGIYPAFVKARLNELVNELVKERVRE